MKPSELRAKDPAQLSKELEELLRAQFGLRMQKATQQLTNSSQLKRVRRVERRVTHPMYGKIVTRSKKYHAHDEKNECGEGDLVLIEECRPISRTKAWRIAKLVEKARAA